jgi:hypothetical protein
MFQGCTGLQNIDILAGVTAIGNSAFQRCTGFTSFTVPANVTAIGNAAFKGCTGLTSFTNNRSMPQAIQLEVFSEVNLNNATLWVPSESAVFAYGNADGWKDFGHIGVTGSTNIYRETSKH